MADTAAGVGEAGHGLNDQGSGGGLECSGTGSSQGLEGHGGEGFLSDSFVGVASLSQAGSERRVSHDAGVYVLAE